MNPEVEETASGPRTPNGLYVSALAVNGFACVLSLYNAVVNHASPSAAGLYLAAIAAMMLARERGGWTIVPLALIAGFHAIWLLVLPLNLHWLTGLGTAQAASFLVIGVAGVLQIAITLQVLDGVRPEKNSWRMAASWGAAVFLTLLAVFALLHRPDSIHRWVELTKESLFLGLYWMVYMRYVAPKPVSWADNKTVLAALLKRSQKPPR